VAKIKKKTKKKKKKSGSGTPGFKSRRFKKSAKKENATFLARFITFSKTALAVAILGGVAFGFVVLEDYVRKTGPVAGKTGELVAVGLPDWVNKPLREKIYSAATANGEDLTIDRDAARSVQQNLSRRVAWLEDIHVQTTTESICITKATWRKPLAMIKRGATKYYVDNKLRILDFVELSSLPIVEITGLTAAGSISEPGQECLCEDVAAAVAVLNMIQKRDERQPPQRRLLFEIQSIDVSNYNGRQDADAPHIIMYAKDKTEIIWGAEIGTWQRYLEAADIEKTAKLFGYYQRHGSLLNGVKYINLRESRRNISRPVDRY